jgi:TP901 family phage tail tape measure protein
MVKSLSDGRMDGSLNTFLSQLSQAKSRTVSLNGEIGKFIDSLKNSLKYNIANTIWRGVTTQFQAAISYAKDIDKSLTDIAMVSNEAAANLDKVLSNAKAGANELGVRTRDYLDAATLFYQMSFDDEDQMEAVQKRTDITLRAAKAAGEDVGTMASNLTAVWQTFDLKGEELERVAAIASRLGADSAIAFKDIVEGMRNSGQAAAELGLDYERLMAIVTTVGDVTQKSASTIDNSFKTMFARMVDLKKGGPGAVDEDGIGLGNISKQLAELGFSPLDSFTGELKDLNTIIDELGGSWDELTDKERINIAQVIGGKRQYTDFLTLMNNFDKYEGFLSSAMNEDGSSLEAQSMLY